MFCLWEKALGLTGFAIIIKFLSSAVFHISIFSTTGIFKKDKFNDRADMDVIPAASIVAIIPGLVSLLVVLLMGIMHWLAPSVLPHIFSEYFKCKYRVPLNMTTFFFCIFVLEFTFFNGIVNAFWEKIIGDPWGTYLLKSTWGEISASMASLAWLGEGLVGGFGTFMAMNQY